MGFVSIDGQYYAPNHPYVKKGATKTSLIYDEHLKLKDSKGKVTALVYPPPDKKRIRKIGQVTPDYGFIQLVSESNLPEPSHEYKFHPTRKWRFDYAWPEHKLALEVDGGIWTQGRHTRGSGRLNDMEKFNHAAMLGWRILYVTPQQLCTVQTADMIRKAMGV